MGWSGSCFPVSMKAMFSAVTLGNPEKLQKLRGVLLPTGNKFVASLTRFRIHLSAYQNYLQSSSPVNHSHKIEGVFWLNPMTLPD